MSYCRWSSDDFQCDVYVYESTGDFWSTNVKGRRRIIPPDVLASFPVVTDDDAASRFARHRAVMRWMDATEPQWFDLSHLPSAGESFRDDTPGECADRLEALRAEGLNVPQYAIDALREEQAEKARQGVGA
jgi:hypothetical protein